MAGGKYYCDYCDKEFQDTASSRKRHLQGLPHLRAKALCSLIEVVRPLIAESSQTYSEGFLRGVCNRFFKTGFCPYGDSCKYIHPKNVSSSNARPPSDTNQAATFSGNHPAAGASSQGDVVTDSMGMAWGNLPPSLKPPPEGGYPPLPFLDWG